MGLCVSLKCMIIELPLVKRHYRLFLEITVRIMNSLVLLVPLLEKNLN